MPKFEDHVLQANRNLKFLSEINQKTKGYFDWQVTTCFYTAVHLVNAHLSKFNLQYRGHKDVNDALNPFKPTSISKVSEDAYKAYNTLQNLSRISRYLVSLKDNNKYNEAARHTYEKQLGKALRHLNTLICYFSAKHQEMNIEEVQVTCSSLTNKSELSSIKVA